MRGAKHPKLPMTASWKQKVLGILDENDKANRSPRNPTELARLVGSDKAGMHKMLLTDQQVSKFVRPVCKALNIDEPMQATPDIPQDEWNRAVEEMRALPAEIQEQALTILRTFLKRVDRE